MTAVAPSATPHAAGTVRRAPRTGVPRPRRRAHLDELSGQAAETILAAVGDQPLALLEGAGAVLLPPLQRPDVRPARERPHRPPRVPARVRAEVTAADALALLDELGVYRVFLVVHCGSADKGLLLTAHHPERFVGAVFMSPALAITPPRPERVMSFTQLLPTDEAGRSRTATTAAGLSGLPGVLLLLSCSTQPHSTKQIETASAGRSRPHRTRSSSR